jgi:hypothetical protein
MRAGQLLIALDHRRREVTCAWGSDAVEIIEPFGIVHTVPAEVFTGGR